MDMSLWSGLLPRKYSRELWIEEQMRKQYKSLNWPKFCSIPKGSEIDRDSHDVNKDAPTTSQAIEQMKKPCSWITFLNPNPDHILDLSFHEMKLV